MEKRAILAAVLMAAVFIIYQTYFFPAETPQTEAARTDDANRARTRPRAGSRPSRNAESRAPGQRLGGFPASSAPDHGGRPALPGGRQQRGRQAAGAGAQVPRREAHGHHRRPGAGGTPGVARRERGGDAGVDDGERRESAASRRATPRAWRSRARPAACACVRRFASSPTATPSASHPRRESHVIGPQGGGRASVGLAHRVGWSGGEVSGAAPDRGRLVHRRLGRSGSPLDEPHARGPRGSPAEARPRGRLDRHRERVVPRGAHAEGGEDSSSSRRSRSPRKRRTAGRERPAASRSACARRRTIGPGQGLGGRGHDVRGAQGVSAARGPRARRDPQLRGLPDPLVLGRAADGLDRCPDPVADELDLQARRQLWRRDHPAHGDLEGPVLSADRQEHAVDEGDAGAPAAGERAAQQATRRIRRRSSARRWRSTGSTR